MSSLEKRAWLMLWSMCPPYLVYFVIQSVWPDWLTRLLPKLALLAAVAGTHAIVYLIGLAIIKHRERGELLLQDARDNAVDARATRSAYFVMLTGLIVVGVVMPFTDSGWKITNTALLVIVLAEAVRYALVVAGYRRGLRLAH